VNDPSKGFNLDGPGHENTLAGDYMAQSYKNYVEWADALWANWDIAYGGGQPGRSIVRDANGGPLLQGPLLIGTFTQDGFIVLASDSATFSPPFLENVPIPGWVSDMQVRCGAAVSALNNFLKQFPNSPPPSDIVMALATCAQH
jgi:hypothetical protein